MTPFLHIAALCVATVGLLVPPGLCGMMRTAQAAQLDSPAQAASCPHCAKGSPSPRHSDHAPAPSHQGCTLPVSGDSGCCCIGPRTASETAGVIIAPVGDLAIELPVSEAAPPARLSLAGAPARWAESPPRHLLLCVWLC